MLAPLFLFFWLGILGCSTGSGSAPAAPAQTVDTLVPGDSLCYGVGHLALFPWGWDCEYEDIHPPRK